MKNELAIIEEFQSSQWGQISIREALCIAQDVLNENKYVYVFKKDNDVFEEKGKKVYVEGWSVIGGNPNYYHSIGSMDTRLEVGYFIKTMESKQGEEKKSITLPTNYWSLWYRFNRMFDEAELHIVEGRVITSSPKKLQGLIEGWEKVLASADGSPMIPVIAEYTQEELTTIVNWSPKQLQAELDKLKELINTKVSTSFTQGESSLLTKGMDGRVKACKSRLSMRRNFWKKWSEQRGDIVQLAKTYSVTTDRWSSVNG